MIRDVDINLMSHEVESFFRPVGKPKEIRMFSNRQFCFVEFANIPLATAALSHLSSHGDVMYGRKVRVGYAEVKRETFGGRADRLTRNMETMAMEAMAQMNQEKEVAAAAEESIQAGPSLDGANASMWGDYMKLFQ